MITTKTRASCTRIWVSIYTEVGWRFASVILFSRSHKNVKETVTNWRSEIELCFFKQPQKHRILVSIILETERVTQATILNKILLQYIENSLVALLINFDQLYTPSTVVDKRKLYNRQKKTIRCATAQKITTYYSIYKTKIICRCGIAEFAGLEYDGVEQEETTYCTPWSERKLMCTTRNYVTHKSKYISYGYCLRDNNVIDSITTTLEHMTYCGMISFLSYFQ